MAQEKSETELREEVITKLRQLIVSNITDSIGLAGHDPAYESLLNCVAFENPDMSSRPGLPPVRLEFRNESDFYDRRYTQTGVPTSTPAGDPVTGEIDHEDRIEVRAVRGSGVMHIDDVANHMMGQLAGAAKVMKVREEFFKATPGGRIEAASWKHVASVLNMILPANKQIDIGLQTSRG
jgi:hypothetical protein